MSLINKLISFTFLFCCAGAALGQATAPAGLLKRTSTKTETRDIGYGGRITIVGGPVGSVTIESWNQSSVEVVADLEIQAPTEDDLNRIAAVTGFAINDEMNAVSIVTTGTHDKAFMKKNAKNFPKKLLGLPWSVNFHIRVPQMCDLDVNIGKGAFTLTGVEGAMLIKAAESNANMTLTGGDVIVSVGAGTMTINIPSRGWRGRGADINLAAGTLNLNLAPSFNAYINGDILRVGTIENNYPALKPRERTKATPTSITGRAGTGGAALNFKLGDGKLTIAEIAKQ
ncbi:MAG: hypothetical protein ABIP75_19465 [Pyrinomonadaceae bacterium]